MKNYKGILYAILASVAFGVMPIFAKFAYINGSNSNTVLFFRFSIATLILFIYLTFKGVSIRVSKKQFILLFITGFLGYTMTTQTLFSSYNYLGVGLATSLHFIYPAFVCILEYILLKKRMSKNKLFSLVFAGLGVYALITFENNTLSTLGVFLATFSGLSYAIYIILMSIKEVKDIDNIVVTMYVTFGAATGIFIYSILNGSLVTKISMNLTVSYICIAVISTILSMVLLLKGIELIGASSASILGTFEPIVSIIMGIIIFKEQLTFSLIMGTIFILISTIILAKDKSGNETTEEIIEKKNKDVGFEI